MEGFGKRLIQAREEMDLTQKKLAELLDITPTRLNYWEKDKREPDLFMFTKIINILNSDANELLGLKKNDIFKVSELNDIGIKKVQDYIKDLSENPKYTKNSNISTDIAAELTQDTTKIIITNTK